jgi:Zn-dependent protease with chaperone function
MSKPIQSELARLDALITRCEALAEQSPGIYRLRVGLLAHLGIVVVVAVVVGSVLLSVLLIFAIAGLSIIVNELVTYGANLIGLDYHGHHYVHVVGGGVALLPLLFAFLVLKSLWLKIPAPAGVDVDRRSAPRLIEEIQSIRKRLRTLTVHRVVVEPEEFNAGVVQVPRLGPLGWHRNHLVVGLPLLEALSPEQIRAVIGHELGHLSRKQTRFRNWIYRSRQSWGRIAYELIREGGFGVLLLAPFLRWYSAYFGAYTFVLARANEYDADKASAEVAGRDNTAAALTTIAAKGRYLGHKFWSDLTKRAAVDPQPPAHPFENYLGLARALPASEVEAGLAHALAATTSHSDTHPCLTDRLKALDMAPQPLAPLAVTAGEALLGDLRAKLIGDTDALWAAKLSRAGKGRMSALWPGRLRWLSWRLGPWPAASTRRACSGTPRFSRRQKGRRRRCRGSMRCSSSGQNMRRRSSCVAASSFPTATRAVSARSRPRCGSMATPWSPAAGSCSTTSTSAVISPAASRSSTISSVSPSNAGKRRRRASPSPTPTASCRTALTQRACKVLPRLAPASRA